MAAKHPCREFCDRGLSRKKVGDGSFRPPLHFGRILHKPNSSYLQLGCPCGHVSFKQCTYSSFLKKKKINFCLHWVFVAARGLSLVAEMGSTLPCSMHAGFSLRWLLLLKSIGSRCMGFSTCGTQAWQLGHAGLVVVAHGLGCSTACGILPDQGSNPCACIMSFSCQTSPYHFFLGSISAVAFPVATT